MKHFATKYSLILFLSMLSLAVHGQTSACHNSLDTAKVIKIAKKNNAYWTDLWFAQPHITFDSLSCTWIVNSTKNRVTKKGHYKYVFNGCTVFTNVKLTIDANSKKVMSREIEVKSYENHE